MARGPFWKGFLKLSLVTCPVAMSPATSESGKVRFHTINRKTGNRVESRYVDAETGKPVDEDDQVRGYEKAAGDYVLLEDDELDQVALDSTRTIDIDMFVPENSIPWIYLDRPHYLVPDGEVGEEAFAVIRDAMAATGMVGISRLVLYRRERAVMLAPRGKGILAWTLRYGDEVREETAYFEAVDAAKPDARLMKLAKSLIEERTKRWSPALVSDPVQKELLKIIAAKKKSARPARGKPAGGGDNVVDLFEALKRSLAGKEPKPRSPAR